MITKERTEFLYAAIADAQGVIRATDSKIGLILVILAIPMTKLGTIYAKCVALLDAENRCLAEVSTVLVVIFACLWVLSFFTAMKAIIAIDNPSRHIDGAKPNGIFYSGTLFIPTFLDAFLNRPIMAKRQLQDQADDLPSTLEALNHELIFEHAKLVYIRSIKLNRMEYAFIFGITWIFVGGVLWFLSLNFQSQ
jgi:hypothetical protein